ncbi:MAG: hypothetical protein QOJ87_2257 [Verrucomicrobiota bacterium]|jgi:hypothetical protein
MEPNSVPACNDAALLTTHLMQRGISVSAETSAAIEAAQAADAAHPFDSAGRTKFSSAYSELARLAAPATADSLRACSNECAKPWKRWWWSDPKDYSLAEQAVLRHHTWGSIALIVLLVVQIYWLIGATLVSGIRRQQDNHPSPTAAQLSPTPAPAAEPTPGPEEEAREDTHIWLLDVWSAVWRWLPDLYQRFFPDPSVQANRRWELYIGTKFVLQIIQTYLLPLLYGWVGSMAFVLRSLILTVNNKSFHVGLNTEYRLRVYLGLLAGLVIGWFLSPKGSSGQFSVADLTPAAVSFLAGYSVEILFSTMDRIVAGFVAAFGGSTVQTPQTSRDSTRPRP